MQFSKRMDSFGPGIFSVLADKKQARLAAGGRVIDLSVGTPNIPPAPHIMQALCEAAAKPENYVYAIQDTQELLEAVTQWYHRRYQVELETDQVVSLLGSQDGLAHIALSIVDPGDTVLVPDPGYPVFSDGPLLAGANLYRMPQKAENDGIIDLDAIPDEVADRAKLMIVSYPNNPVTSVAPAAFYEKLVEFGRRHDVIILHDNAYSELSYDGLRCGSFLAYPGAMEVGVEFNSLSKTYGLAGARIGFALGNREVISKLRTLKSNMDYGMFLPVQKAAIAAITGPQECVETTRLAYQRRRDVLVEGLCSIGWQMEKPKATMFVWAPLPAGYTDSTQFVLDLLDRTGVLVTPGSAFGPEGEGHVRMALVQDEEDMRYAIASIKESGILQG
ncbi:MAG: aminotransferase class I/II-fold pyridoxal phosphate-dependent enzyme [Eubacteriales bacterium]